MDPMNEDKDPMLAAVTNTLAAVALLQAQWINQLPADRLEQLHAMTQKGVRIGAQVIGGSRPVIAITGVDARGNWIVIEQIGLTRAPRH